MLRTNLFAAVLVLGAAGAASAQELPFASGSVVGGGYSRIVGGGDSQEVVHDLTGPAQPNRRAEPTGGTGGGWGAVRYLEPAPVAPGAPATVIGGGDGPQVVAAQPTATDAATMLANRTTRPRG